MPKKPKLEPIPPGNYEMVIERTRKVRNKPLRRIHMRVVGGDFDGRKMINTIKEHPLAKFGIPEPNENVLARIDSVDLKKPS